MALSTFPVADVLLKIAEQEGVNLSVEGVDDVCYGLVISSDKTFLSFLQEHALPYNWLIVDGDPIRVVRRAVNDSLVMDHTITQADCVPSGGAAVAFKRTDEGNLPREIEIQYTDPDRQFATTTRSGRHLGAPFENPGRSISIDFLISATQAREMAFDTLYRIWSQQLTVSFEHRDITIEPGDTILLSCDQGTYTLLVTEAIYTASRTTQVSATVLLASSGITIPAGDWTNWPPAPAGSPDAATSPDFVPPPSSPHGGLNLQISAAFVGGSNLTADGTIDAPAVQQLSANFIASGLLTANATRAAQAMVGSATFAGSGALVANIAQSGWQTVFTAGGGNNSAGWNGYNLRNVLSAFGVNGTKFRLTLFASTAASCTIDGLYAGHGAGASSYNYDGTQVPVTVGSTQSFTISAGTSVVTDEITYTIDGTKQFIVACHFSATSATISYTGGAIAGFKSAANESATTTVTGYSTGVGNPWLVKVVEVFV